MTPDLRAEILAGGYWLVAPDLDTEVAIVACGAVLPEAIEARQQLAADVGAALLVVTSPDRLEREWRDSLATGGSSHIDALLSDISEQAGIVSVVDAHPATLSWLGAVRRNRMAPLGVDHFGQSGDVPDLYRLHGLDADAIVGAAARLIAPRRH
jgi:pyruvate dehydrogenase E1 component